MLIFGHRGSPGFPRRAENTLGSFRRAFEEGADGVEMDLRRAADGEIVVIHDETVDRTTNGTGRVAEMRYCELSDLDAGHGESIPQLEGVLQEFAGRFLNLEVKDAGLVQDILRIAHTSNLRAQIILSGFAEFWEELGVAAEELQIGLLASTKDASKGADYLIATADKLRARAIHLPANAAEDNVISVLHRAGLAVRVYTVNEPADIRRLLQAGADAVFTDFPGRAVEVRRSTAD